jgi:hypothetical protein
MGGAKKRWPREYSDNSPRDRGPVTKHAQEAKQSKEVRRDSGATGKHDASGRTSSTSNVRCVETTVTSIPRIIIRKEAREPSPNLPSESLPHQKARKCG